MHASFYAARRRKYLSVWCKNNRWIAFIAQGKLYF